MTAAYPILPSEIEWSIYNTPFNRSQTETVILYSLPTAWGIIEADFTEKDIIDFEGSGYTANDRAELQTIVKWIHPLARWCGVTPEFAQVISFFKKIKNSKN